MNKYTTIPEGYRITVTSWENDADNYKTKSVAGVSKEFAQFLVEFVKLFTSKNNRQNSGIGNLYEPDEEEMGEAFERVCKVIVAHKPAIRVSDYDEYFFDENGVSESGWQEYAYYIGLAGGEFWTRVMDSYKVEYIPEMIKIQDVTEEFK